MNVRAADSLELFFRPKTVALIGATERPQSVGRRVLQNLVQSPFGGTVFPVNSKRNSVLGIHCYPTILDIPDPVELAIIVTPARTAAEIIQQCGQKKVPGAIIISAGFRETGETGWQLERTLLEEAQAANIRVIGPNCLGLIAPWTGLNATFANTAPQPGHLAFISQSGALCTAILDWSVREHVGFSAFISTGSMVDIAWPELIDYLADDWRTRSILLYMESVGTARTLLSAIRAVAVRKPVVILKAGRTSAAASAAACHTGSLAGDDEVFEAAVRRCGAVRVDRLDELFAMAEVLEKQPRPKGPRLTVVTNAGGPGVIAADALLRAGGTLTRLTTGTVNALDDVLPRHWSHQNPVDIIGDAGPERYAKAVQIAANDPNTDGLLMIHAPQGIASSAEVADASAKIANHGGTPVLAAWMGAADAVPGREILTRAGIPAFEFPDTAARAFHYMWQYTYNLRGIYETPSHTGTWAPVEIGHSHHLVGTLREKGRTLLTELESKRILQAAGIPTVPTSLATNEDEAVQIAKEIGYPVVLKLNSQTASHKSKIGGVQLHLYTESSVRTAFRTIEAAVAHTVEPSQFEGVVVQPMITTGGYELILGSSTDPQFGPVLVFGAGGRLVEVLRDRALGLPPLNTTLARRMLEQTRIYTALREDDLVDLDALEDLLVRFSHLVGTLREVSAIDINPLLISSEGIVALDARMVLFEQGTSDDELPPLAIRPYPAEYVRNCRLPDGTSLRIRPIGSEDEPAMGRFHRTLSDRSVYFRYFRLMQLSERVAHERLAHLCFVDYDRQIGLVAEIKEPGSEPANIVAVARLTRIPRMHEAELAIVVGDSYQKRGIGTELLRQLIHVAKSEKLVRITGDILAANVAMQVLCSKAGFELSTDLTEGLVTASLRLS